MMNGIEFSNDDRNRLISAILASLVCIIFITISKSLICPAEEDYATFRRVYEAPILKSRAPDCSKRESELGRTRSEKVSINIDSDECC
jgi:hypothetical protein